jgi:hypothetical protein
MVTVGAILVVFGQDLFIDIISEQKMLENKESNQLVITTEVEY